MMRRLVPPLLLMLALFVGLSACDTFDDSAGALPTRPRSITGTPSGQAEPTGTLAASPSSTPRAASASTPTSAPTQAPMPSESATATPTVTPTQTPILQQLTRGGCCTRPFWAPDSSRVLFLDRPDPTEPAGIWAVSVDEPHQLALYTERIALYTDDLRYLVDSDGQRTFVERLPDAGAGDLGDRWQVPAGGRPVSLSPGRTRIAWQVSNDALAVETRITEIWVANLDGSEPRSVISLPRGGFIGWISDDLLLLTGRESLAAAETIISAHSLSGGSASELVRGERLRGPALSPDGGWLVTYEIFGDPQRNGLWAVRTDGSDRLRLPSELFGAYQWRDSRRLLIIPFMPDAKVHALWEFDVEEGRASRLTDPAVTPFKIANGDWRVSPDGRRIVFVASDDLNLWLLTLGTP